MQLFLYHLFAGLSIGGVYALLALALVMIYRSTHHVNFAQGEMAMFSTYLAWTLIGAGLPYWLAFAITLCASFATGVLIQRAIIEPLGNAPTLVIVVVFMALYIILNSTAGLLYDYELKDFPSPFPAGMALPGGYMSGHQTGMILVTAAVLALIFCFFRFTQAGLAMRAVAFNPISSRLVGIRVAWMLAVGWGLAAAVGAVAGMMTAPVLFLDPNMMSGVLLYAFAAALLGGIDNPWGAVLGGFIVGIVEALGGAYLVGTELKLTLALGVIVLVLVVRPNGLFGNTLMSRV